MPLTELLISTFKNVHLRVIELRIVLLMHAAIFVTQETKPEIDEKIA